VTTTLSFIIAIPADHPSLPGHFPGRPVVPGAVILAEIVDAAVRALAAGTRIASFPSVKFVNPMLPEQRCELTLTDHGAGAATFELTHNAQRVASGSLRYERSAPTP
jgi:3-hydroxyacyl-[acyl-carrier-protein] dehydratase